MKIFVSFFTILSVLLFSTVLMAQNLPNSYLDVTAGKPKGELLGAGGEYTYSFPINIPAFRNLAPNLSITYNSADTSRGGRTNFVGAGWRLAGLSAIQRQSVGGGVPTFDDGQDVFVLDGQELLACNDAAATNKWTGKYPLRYLTDRPSPSCSSGGNFATRIETYQKIVYDSLAKQFLVTSPDGTRSTYKAVGIADTSATAWNAKMAFSSRWVLSQVTDTQSSAPGVYTNVVDISYRVGTALTGYAEVPNEITYGSYKVVFGYQQEVRSVAEFGTGSPDVIGRQDKHLVSIMLYDGSTPLRAYKLTKIKSGLASVIKLSGIETYGSDFAITGEQITGGTKLPTLSFEYSSDALTYLEKTYPGVLFTGGALALDPERDRIDDLYLFGGSKFTYNQTSGSYRSSETSVSKHYGFDAAFNLLTKVALVNPCPSFEASYPSTST